MKYVLHGKPWAFISPVTRELTPAVLSKKKPWIIGRVSKTKGPSHTALTVRVCRNSKPLPLFLTYDCWSWSLALERKGKLNISKQFILKKKGPSPMLFAATFFFVSCFPLFQLDILSNATWQTAALALWMWVISLLTASHSLWHLPALPDTWISIKTLTVWHRLKGLESWRLAGLLHKATCEETPTHPTLPSFWVENVAEPRVNANYLLHCSGILVCPSARLYVKEKEKTKEKTPTCETVSVRSACSQKGQVFAHWDELIF